MTLDVVIPTYNRSALLRKTVVSLLEASRPQNLSITIIVVDNNSSDRTRDVVCELQQDATLPLRYVLETTQGSSASRNAGIAHGQGELIGFVDDDEEVETGWFLAVSREFAQPDVDFIGGPCLLKREVTLPEWLPPGYHAAVGVILPKSRGSYGPDHSGMLNGGNAVLRRAVFSRIGVFSPRLGRSAKNLLSEEDADLFRRLQAASLHGTYVPELIIFHHLHEQRLTRGYHRRWAYWRAVSQGVLDREVRETVSYFLGIPRYKIGRAFRGMLKLPNDHLARGRAGHAFANELACWDLAGFIYGKYFFNEPNHYATRGSLPGKNWTS